MSWTTRQQPLTARNMLRGLMALPWNAPLFGPVQMHRPES